MLEQGVTPDPSAGMYTSNYNQFLELEVTKVSADPIALQYGVQPLTVAVAALITLGVTAGGVLAALLPIIKQKPKEILSRLY